jgi:hypothetical protein
LAMRGVRRLENVESHLQVCNMARALKNALATIR